MATVKGIVGNVYLIPAKESGKEPRRVIQVITHDGIRLGLEDVADMSTGGYSCVVQDQVSLECRVSEWRGRVQYSYWGGANGGGDSYLRNLFAVAHNEPGGKKSDEKGKGPAPF